MSRQLASQVSHSMLRCTAGCGVQQAVRHTQTRAQQRMRTGGHACRCLPCGMACFQPLPPTCTPPLLPLRLQQVPDSDVPGAERGARPAARGAQDRRHLLNHAQDAGCVSGCVRWRRLPGVLQACNFSFNTLCCFQAPPPCACPHRPAPLSVWQVAAGQLDGSPAPCPSSAAAQPVSYIYPTFCHHLPRSSRLGGFDFMPSPSDQYYRELPKKMGNLLTPQQASNCMRCVGLL